MQQINVDVILSYRLQDSKVNTCRMHHRITIPEGIVADIKKLYISYDKYKVSLLKKWSA